MFGFLKKKLGEIADSLSGKIKSKAEGAQGQLKAEETAQGTGVEGPRAEEVPQITDEEMKRQEEVFESPMEAEPEKGSDFEPPKEEPINLYAEAHPSQTEPEPEAPRKEEEIGPTFFEEAEEKLHGLDAEIGKEGGPLRIELRPELEAEPEEIEPIVKARREAEKSQVKKSFFRKLTEKVVKKVTEKRMGAEDVDPMLQNMEASLIEADVAVEVADKIKGDLRSALIDSDIKRGKEKEAVVGAFRTSLMDILDVPKIDFGSLTAQKRPVLVAFWGFNGAGKTTSLAKTAAWLKEKGYTCVLAAADTFRAGAEEQLDIHADRIGVRAVKHKYGADPAAVIFDAVEHAKAKGIDFVLADTAGRAHTNANLMDQMRKIVRVNKPDLKVLVIDSLTGNDALLQARAYGEVGVDAVIFTKVDVNEKGGAILSVTHELKKPIIFLGIGQDYRHFEEFDAKRFVDRVLS